MTRHRLGRISGHLLLDIILTAAVATVALAVYRVRIAGERVMVDQHDWNVLLQDARGFGPADARVTVVEFLDYRCPVCSVYEGVFNGLEQEHPEALRRVVRFYPLARNRNADSAAFAAACAAEQGMWESMHSALYAHAPLIDSARWDSLATLAGVRDGGAFLACVRSDPAHRVVDADRALGARFGVDGVPTVIVDREWLRGVDAPALRSLLLKRLRQ